MNVFDTLDEVQPTEDRAVALGLFDGMHRGHREVIRMALDCREQGLCPSVFTYRIQNQIPQAKGQFRWIVSQEDKLRELEAMGIRMVVQPTFEEFCDLEPEEFAVGFLVKKMRAKVICCGSDFHFGKRAAGSVDDLRRLCRPYGVEVKVALPVLDYGHPVSSTRIRAHIFSGEMEDVWRLQGRPYSIHFPVVSGNKIGRTLRFPTINQIYPEQFAVPRYGVYVSVAQVDGKLYPSVTNVGVKPTIGAEHPLAETYIIGFQGNLYGERILVRLCRFLRPEKKFDSIDDLKDQIAKDTQAALTHGPEYIRRLTEEKLR